MNSGRAFEHLGWLSRQVHQMIGEQMIARINRRALDQAGHLPSDADLSEREQHKAIEDEAERREREES